MVNRPAEGSDALFTIEHLAPLVITELGVAAAYADANRQIVAHTPGLQAYLPRTGEDPLGLSLVDLFPELIGHEDDLAGVARGRISRFDLPKINRVASDGASRHYLSLTALLHPKVPDHLVLLVRDVTDEGRLEQRVTQSLNELRLLRAELEAANRELVRLNEEKSAFLRMAAHDLRAPLAVIKGYVDLIIGEGGRLGEQVVDYLGVVQRRTEEMSHLIDNLLDVEKIESGEVTLRREPVDLASLVEQVGRSFQPLALQSGLALQWTIPTGLPHPHADWDRLVQALYNLVSNALKFTPAGGQVRIEAFERGDDVGVEVSDTGPRHFGRGPGAFVPTVFPLCGCPPAADSGHRAGVVHRAGHCRAARRAGLLPQPGRAGQHLWLQSAHREGVTIPPVGHAVLGQGGSEDSTSIEVAPSYSLRVTPCQIPQVLPWQ